MQERLTLEKDLRDAIKNKEMFLHYQPQVCLRSGKIIGVEALLRWQSPTHGFVSPAKFIPIAEETGLIISIGEWVLRTACAQNRTWQLAGLPLIKMAVNISSRQFKEQNLVDITTQILQETELKANYLELEITESLIIENIQQAINTMNQLHAMGVTLSLDDFGTGYSSLNYLKRLPIDVLKIDRSFVRELTIGSDDAAIVKAIISLAHNLQLSVIAEGVETQSHLEYLQRHGCDEIQGYYISRPVAPEALAKLLQQEEEVADLAKNIISELTKPVAINNTEIFNIISIGISIYPNDRTEVSKLLDNAIMAMERAKQQGQNKYHFYSSELNTNLQ
ncbi:EAL domain-containing protein, partial [Nostoc sp. CCCryo 231-06]|nr:EAL domain-containing protein [Nostoc sp. CCCryo 231-06]